MAITQGQPAGVFHPEIRWTIQVLQDMLAGMNLDWSYLLAAVGLACVFEGLMCFLTAHRLHEILSLLARRPPAELRIMGIIIILFGLALVYCARYL